MKRFKIFSTLFILLGVQFFSAQDMHFTQFYSAPMYLNPAFTGANVCSRFTLAYRNQWPGVATAYKSYLTSFDHYLNRKNVGLGLIFGVDESGTGALRTTIINPSLAYEIRINRSSLLRLGLQPGFTIKTINFNKLLFGDQIYRGGGTGNVPTIENPTQTKRYMDISTGALYSYSTFWIGASFYHINKPNESLFGDPTVITPVKYSIHGGYKHLVNKDEVDDMDKRYISTAIHYRGQREFDQFDIGFYYSQNVFNVGLWYRGIPGLKAYKPGYSNNDAVSIIVGMSIEKLNIGYSYDITISKLSGNSKGAHELTMSYQLCTLKRGSKTKNRRIVYCPEF